MKHRAIWTLVLAMCGMSILAAAPKPKAAAVPKAAVLGAPTIQVDQKIAFYLWVEMQVVHLRFTGAGKPTLFEGRFDFDRALKSLERVQPEAGGWAKSHGDRVVMFSATLRNGQDGIDITFPGPFRGELTLQIDGQEVQPEQVNLGSGGGHPSAIPLQISTR